MVQLNIIVHQKDIAEQMVNSLFEHQFLTEAAIIKPAEILRSNSGFKGEDSVIISGITKSLLFNEINNHLKEHFTNHPFTFYTTAIIYMDNDYRNKIRNETASV
ncbi:MAG: hypothetical protein ACON48_05815 [Chitinophagales bacterium]